ATPIPTRPATPTPQPVFRLLGQQQICGEEPAPRIEVETLNALLDPMPGVEILVNWDDGSDHFFTGFKPAFGAGYGDFEMTPGISYSVRVAEGSPEVSGLRVETCENGLPGGWRLTFQYLRLSDSE
ncbi:MAG: hypothetical protein D6706_03730, partial [Chloroflexi bacterium]